MIRVRLGERDLGQVRLASSADPFAETMWAARRARSHSPNSPFEPWRQSLQGSLGPNLRPLASICPTNVLSLDLSALVGRAESIAEGIDALMSVTRQDMHAEINGLWMHEPEPWPWRRLDSDLELRGQLGCAIEHMHSAAVEPYWTQIRNVLQAERAHQAHVMAQVGIDAFLANLYPPLIQWRPPLLLINSGRDAEITLSIDGNGLVIVPSVFLGPYPSLQVSLAYPAARGG